MGCDPDQPQRDQGNAALTTAWFPRPAGEADLELLEPCAPWTPAALFALLVDPTAIEWRDKVGVTGPNDGSAKPTTRLLASRGWVCKTRLDQSHPSLAAAHAALAIARDAGRDAGIWHPEKLWALLRIGDGWHPLTVCRELATLRRLETFEARAASWVDMIRLGLEVARFHRIGLDLNPANFGREKPSSPLYYLDDELYDAVDERAVAGAIVARIPEHPDAGMAAWRDWGLALHAALEAQLDVAKLRDEIRLYPLTERYEPARFALLDGLCTPRVRRAPRELTCVFADVHGNLAALEAVLDDAREHGADRFLFLGDVVGYGPEPAACIRRLAELREAVIIRGNHDHAIGTGHFDVGMNSLARQCAEWTRAQLDDAALDWLRVLPIEYAGDRWLAVHGAPKDPARFLAYVYEMTYEDNLRHLREHEIPLCFYGHTHVQLIHAERAGARTKLPGIRSVDLGQHDYWLVNPGSVGQPRDGDARAAYALWDRRTARVANLRVSYPVERTIEALRATPLPTQLATRLRAGS